MYNRLKRVKFTFYFALVEKDWDPWKSRYMGFILDNLIKNNNLRLLLFKKGSNITISSVCVCFIPLDIVEAQPV